MDATHGDLTRVPLAYPLPPVEGPRLVLAGCEHPVRPRRARPLGAAGTPPCAHCGDGSGHLGPVSLGARLAALGETPLADRTPVLAVGSNAASAVIRYKLGRRGASAVVPLVTGVVRGLDVGHSAHVSRGGYVPATPVHRSGARTRVVLQLLDDEQLEVVDATEGNYERVELTATRYPVVLAGGGRPRRVHVYTSLRGVLGRPGERPVPMLPQPDVLAVLRAAGVPHTTGEPHEVASRFGSSPAVRDAANDALERLGLVHDSGLHTRPAGDLRWADALAPARPRPTDRRGSGSRSASAGPRGASRHR